jgi:hypothetical protein
MRAVSAPLLGERAPFVLSVLCASRGRSLETWRLNPVSRLVQGAGSDPVPVPASPRRASHRQEPVGAQPSVK